MAFDPADPFFETTISNLIDQRLGQSQLSSLVRQLQGAIANGTVTTWNWSGSYTTDVTVQHGLGVKPTGVIVPGAIRKSEMTTDARAPWICAVDPIYTDTSFTVRVMTFNKAVIGAFAANEPIPWIAYV